MGAAPFPDAVEKKPLPLFVVVVVEEVEEVPSAEGVEGALPPPVALLVEEGWKSDVFNEPEDRDDADRLFSATTLSDFSKTFHSLIVLSVGCIRHAARMVLVYVGTGETTLQSALRALHAS